MSKIHFFSHGGGAFAPAGAAPEAAGTAGGFGALAAAAGSRAAAGAAAFGAGVGAAAFGGGI